MIELSEEYGCNKDLAQTVNPIED
ncbi:hypothetical protein F383_22518 [Gossypium arboreum]|uniref:Uncharacterized protein n=1 Tax=Gossypium arboreum TaxID=29729 RepID=A0A0B0NML5_GOSAR|nr:hypothetical protein F383_22518 [Gossypium arboreum]